MLVRVMSIETEIENSAAEALCAEIKQIRGKRSRDKFGELIGYHPNTIAQYEDPAKPRMPELEYLAMLASKCGADLEKLITLRLEASQIQSVREVGHIREGKPPYATSNAKPDSLTSSVEHYNEVDKTLKEILETEEFSPSPILLESLKTLMFTGQLSHEGMVILVNSLKVSK